MQFRGTHAAKERTRMTHRSWARAGRGSVVGWSMNPAWLVLAAALPMSAMLAAPTLAQIPPAAATPNPPAKLSERPANPPYPIAVIDGKEVPPPSIKMGDPEVVKRLIDEGKNRSRVMDYITHLSVNIGSRLTGSTRSEQAERWAVEQFKSMGIDNARMEKWGTIGVGFDRGPSTGKVLMREERRRRPAAGDTPRTERATPTPANDQPGGTAPAAPAAAPPQRGSGAGDPSAQPPAGDAPARDTAPEREVTYTPVRDLQFSTLSWTPGTDGPKRGPVIKLPLDDEEYAEVKPKLKGAWILMPPPPPVGQRGIRQRLSTYYEQRRDARKSVADGADPSKLPIASRLVFDGVLGFISTSRDERVWTGGAPGWRDLTMDTLHQDVHVSVRLSDYDYINSRVADNEPIEVEFDLKHEFRPGPVDVFNVIAEIKGTEKPEEVIIISGHLDSWDGPGSQGTTDNGTGTCVTLEAARILTAAGAKPKRTIRFMLWTGEEQGLLGARAYVKSIEKDHDNILAMFNDDGGTNPQSGVPAAENQVEMLAAATAPVNNIFWSAVDGKFINCNIRNTGKSIRTHGSSDHAAFNDVGIPGFYWDENGRADYGYGWHTQNDRVDLAIPEYLMQSATNSAVIAYNLASADQRLPRPPERARVGASPNQTREANRTAAEREGGISATRPAGDAPAAPAPGTAPR